MKAGYRFYFTIVVGAILEIPEEALADPIITPIIAVGTSIVNTVGPIITAVGGVISTVATVARVFGAVGETAAGVQAARANEAAALQEARNIEVQAQINADLAEREALEITQRAEFNAMASLRDASIAEQEAEFNAQASRLEAAQVANEAIEAERVAKRKNKATLARQRAITGGRGIEVGSGSPLLLTLDSIEQANLEAQGLLGTGRAGEGAKLLEAELAKFVGRVKAGRFRSEADLIRFEGETGAIRARRGGDIELFQGRVQADQARRRAAIAGLGVGSSIVTGVGRVGGIFA